MNSPLRFWHSRLRKLRLWPVLVGLAAVTSLAQGQVNVATASLTNNGNPYVVASPNTPFVMSLAVTTNFVSVGYSVLFTSLDGSGLFRVVSRVNTSPIHPNTGTHVFPLAPDEVALAGTRGFLNPTTADLGGTSDQVNNQAPGSFGLQDLQIMALNLQPGAIYHIFLDPRSIMVDTSFRDVNIGGSNGPVFTIYTDANQIPEPATFAFLLLGGAGVLALRKKKRS